MPSRGRAPSIRRRLLLLTFLASSVALLLAAGVFIGYQQRACREELVDDIRALAEMVAETSLSLTARGAPDGPALALRAIETDAHVLAAALYDREGALRASFVRPGHGDGAPPRAQPDGAAFDSDGLRLFHAVERDAAPVGTVYVYTDLERMNRYLRAQVLMVAGSILPAFFVAALVSAGVQRRIAAPLRDLTRRVRALQRGALHAPEAPSERDEVLVLTAAFDQMQATIRQRDEALQRSEQYYRALIDRALDVTLILDADLRVRFASPSVRAVLGYPPERLVGLDLLSLVCEDDGPTVREALMRSQAHAGQPLSLEFRAGGADGEPRVLEGRGTNLLADPAVSGIVMNVRDITERHRAAAALREAKEAAEAAARAKTEFLANVSHEIRTPMNAVLGMSQVLGHTGLTEDQRHYVDVIRASGSVLLRLIDDLLDISRLEFGRLTLRAEAMDVASAIDGALDMLASAAHARGIELASVVDPAIPAPLRGDAARLQQILVNLLGNALDFTEAGYVEVRAELQALEPDAARLRLTVTDTGSGVPEALRARAFDPFVKGEAPAQRRHGGTGIGLAICRSLVEQMDGRIGIDESWTAGARLWLTVRLPLAAGARSARERLGLSGRRVLVAEPGAITAACLRETLAGLGAEACTVADAEGCLTALAAAAAGGPGWDAILVDVGLALAAGERLLPVLRAQPAAAAGRVALLWPLGTAAPPPPLAELPALSKPVRQTRLAELVREGTPPARPPAGPGEKPSEGASSARPRTAPEGSRAGGLGEPARILIVEDNLVNQEVLRLMLAQMGYGADCVGDGVEALEALVRTRYDLVLMDCQMPGMDGYRATLELRRREPAGRRVPVVGVSAHALEEERERCLAAGMDDWIVKPLGEERLRAVLQRWLPEPGADCGGQLNREVWNGLRRLEAAGEPGTLARLVELFLADAPERIARMRRALEAGDGPGLSRQAHAFKGGCQHLGAERLAALGAAIDEAAGSGRLGEAAARLDELETSLEALAPLLRACVRQPFEADAAARHAGVEPPAP